MGPAPSIELCKANSRARHKASSPDWTGGRWCRPSRCTGCFRLCSRRTSLCCEGRQGLGIDSSEAFRQDSHTLAEWGRSGIEVAIEAACLGTSARQRAPWLLTLSRVAFPCALRLAAFALAIRGGAHGGALWWGADSLAAWATTMLAMTRWADNGTLRRVALLTARCQVDLRARCLALRRSADRVADLVALCIAAAPVACGMAVCATRRSASRTSTALRRV